MDLSSFKETALIGHTGFVGSNLLKQMPHTLTIHTYNSKNFTEMAHREFDLVVCAGISAAKWLANREPRSDKEQIDKLQATLTTVRAKCFVLISTIDVYKDPRSVTENDIPTTAGNHAYGAHRYEFEQFVQSHFSNNIVLRLPALFGPGLKKNALFDMLNDNNVSQINPQASFQWYPVDRLWSDVETAAKANLRLLNVSTEPITTGLIADNYFARVKLTAKPGEPPCYDMWSLHADKFGGQGNYLLAKESVLSALSSFVTANTHACI